MIDVYFHTMFADFRENNNIFRPEKNLDTQKKNLFLLYD